MYAGVRKDDVQCDGGETMIHLKFWQAVLIMLGILSIGACFGLGVMALLKAGSERE